LRALRTESGKPVRFVPPGPDDPYYEIGVYQSGRVATRPESAHDWFNALVWLAFPRAKARINALHARELPRDPKGKRGPLRDLLTIFDEGGAIIVSRDLQLLELLRSGNWKELFCKNRDQVRQGMKVAVFGHAVMEQALEPWLGITCKAIVLPEGRDAGDLDAGAAQWLADAPPGTSPKALLPLPIFGYPGWCEGQDAPFYEDKRYFRP
jgi:DUF3025 family protein